MTATIAIREAGAADVAALSRVGRDAFAAAYAGTAPETDIERHLADYFGEAAIRAEIERDEVTYLRADDGELCVGLVKLRRLPAPPAVPVPDAVEVQQLYVASSCQRRGVGRLLMDRAVDVARAAGSAGIWLSVWTEADWATAFYRSYGFRDIDTLPFQLGDSIYSDYLMWLPLDGQELSA